MINLNDVLREQILTDDLANELSRHYPTWSGDPYGEGASWGFGSMDSRVVHGYDERRGCGYVEM